MSLPTGFVFSQASLQDYVDCPRRFQLRYLLRIAWPTPLPEPILESEQHLQRGLDFHRLIHQYLLGIPAELLTASIADAELRNWWQAYQAFPPADLPPTRYAEVALSAPLAGYRLLAQYDLIAAAPGEWLTIVDWKTNLRRPTRAWLERRLQTRVYRYLLVVAGQRFNSGQSVSPEMVAMVYWFANFPAQPERFRYGQAEWEADKAYLEALAGEIAGQAAAGDWDMTEETERCHYCHYFSLCERKVNLAPLTEVEEGLAEEPASPDINLEQVGEIEF